MLTPMLKVFPSHTKRKLAHVSRVALAMRTACSSGHDSSSPPNSSRPIGERIAATHAGQQDGGQLAQQLVPACDRSVVYGLEVVQSMNMSA